MKVPLGWLAEWVDLPDEAELCERLTLAGLEIEEVLRSGPDLSAIRVGRVVERRQHPNADRLSLCRVDVGGPETISVVCGAPNVAQGQKVAVALPGTKLPDGTVLKKSKIRGEASEGMICSARELGLSDEHAGILVLDPSAKIGAALPEVLSAGDTILDVELTPNRGDWVSMLGMAREIARAVRRRRCSCRRRSRPRARARRRKTWRSRSRRPTAARAMSAASCAACGSARRRTGCARGSSRRALRSINERRRRDEPGDARARPAAARVRPRDPARREDPRAPRAGGREARDPRRRDARARRDRPGDRRRRARDRAGRRDRRRRDRGARRHHRPADRERAVRAGQRAAQPRAGSACAPRPRTASSAASTATASRAPPTAARA